ncbi:hypothetical protein BH10CHL1_BH10CHL1_03380 [soil metagenome]
MFDLVLITGAAGSGKTLLTDVSTKFKCFLYYIMF